MSNIIRKLLGFEKDVKRCNALVDDGICGREAYGWNGPETVRYCKRHVPDEATPWPGRVDVEFADESTCDPSEDQK